MASGTEARYEATAVVNGHFAVEVLCLEHKNQRYPTVGDWFWLGENLHIRVSNLPDWRYEALIAVHELVEVLLCKQRKVKEEDVDAFDMEYEKNRQSGDESEPGDHPKAPYYAEHQFATKVEKMLCEELGVNWDEYDRTVRAL